MQFISLWCQVPCKTLLLILHGSLDVPRDTSHQISFSSYFFQVRKILLSIYYVSGLHEGVQKWVRYTSGLEGLPLSSWGVRQVKRATDFSSWPSWSQYSGVKFNKEISLSEVALASAQAAFLQLASVGGILKYYFEQVLPEVQGWGLLLLFLTNERQFQAPSVYF